MIRYVLALLLLNVYSRSLGAPSPNPMATLLVELAKHCENKYLATQIESRIVDCSESPLNKKKHFECIIFFDINSQLCAAVAHSRLLINEDYTSKINEEQDVKELCEAAKDWNFTLSQKYNFDIRAVFQTPVKCAKVCGVEDVMSEDSIFYCKYYKWGWDMLKTSVSTLPQANSIIAQNVSPNMSSTDLATKKIEVTPVSKNDADIQVLKNESTTKSNIPIPMNGNADPIVKNSEVKIEGNVAPNTTLSTVSKPIIPVISQTHINAETSSEILPASSEVHANIETGKQSDTIKKDSAKKDDDTQNNQLEKSELNSQPDDYHGLDIEDGKDGFQDTEGDEDDPVLPEPGINADQNQNKLTADRIEPPSPPISSLNVDSPERSYYPNTIPEDFEEDDDHFFPFFLTAIILVVLLYVLYHNKNRVTKVFLGLLVEGRQQGRRRNSRGHAYRRLDTLEQAMSGNLAAPPSKIIY